MRYFTLLDFQHWVLAVFFGLLAVILVYVTWGLPLGTETKNEAGSEQSSTELPSKSHQIPPIIIFVYVGAILWAVGYALVEGVFGTGL